jgi:hypothetical protein
VIRADYDHNSQLRESRDNVLDILKKRLKENSNPSCAEFMQGSYGYRVGIRPIEDLEYDVDVGLRFYFRDSEHTAEEVRGWVFKAVEGHTNSVEAKGPCIRVNYAAGYHVDLVCYSTWREDGTDVFRLAHQDGTWKAADPPALAAYVKTARKTFEGTEDTKTSTDQLRRIIRYLKRWNDECIPFDAEYKIVGLGFLLLAISTLTPKKLWNGLSDDLSGLQQVAQSAASVFGRIVLKKPTPEYEDMARRLSEAEMANLKHRFETLAKACQSVRDDADPVTACKTMKEVLGRDFPVPEQGDSAKKTSSPAIITSSASAHK